MQTKTMQERLQAIQNLDFTQLRKKACLSKPEGEGWTEEQALEAEKWYKRFLSLTLTHPHIKAVPNGPIDAFWHRHILDTERYASDCEATVGYFIHHYPYYGLNGEEDEKERDNSFDETNRAYREYFEEDCTTMHAFSRQEYADSNNGGGEKCGFPIPPCKWQGKAADDIIDINPAREVETTERIIDTQGFRHGSISPPSVREQVMAGASCNGRGSGTGCSRK